MITAGAHRLIESRKTGGKVVVLMDIRMPRTNGIEATWQITAALPDAQVPVLTTFDLDEYAFAALRAGASGCLLKNAERAELLAAIRTAAKGDAVVAPRVTRRPGEVRRPAPVRPVVLACETRLISTA